MDIHSTHTAEPVHRAQNAPSPCPGYTAGTTKFRAQVRARRERLVREFAALFPDPDTLTVEIGCGHGHFLAAYAEAFPHETCLGIDITRARTERARKKARLRELHNIHVLRCEATELLLSLPAHVRFRRIFVLFPDPWPKRRHWKNRFLHRGFLQQLAQRAGEGAGLHLRTDHPGYFDWAKKEIAQTTAWDPDPHAPWPFEHSTVFQEKACAFHSLTAFRTATAR